MKKTITVEHEIEYYEGYCGGAGTDCPSMLEVDDDASEFCGAFREYMEREKPYMPLLRCPACLRATGDLPDKEAVNGKG